MGPFGSRRFVDFDPPCSVLLQLPEDLPGASHDGIRNAGQARHLDPVAAVRRPGSDTPEKDHFVAPLPHENVQVDIPLLLPEPCHLVVVGREDRSGAAARVVT